MPKDIGELVDTVVSRLLDRLRIPNELMRRWEGRAPPRLIAGGQEPQEE
jgi:4-hydroxy-3-polyprenylbenzoate decarboxylase